MVKGVHKPSCPLRQSGSHGEARKVVITAQPETVSTAQTTSDPIYESNRNIDTDIFSLAEVNIAIKQMKLGKAPGLDGIPIEVWQLPKLRKDLLTFCNKTRE